MSMMMSELSWLPLQNSKSFQYLFVACGPYWVIDHIINCCGPYLSIINPCWQRGLLSVCGGVMIWMKNPRIPARCTGTTANVHCTLLTLECVPGSPGLWEICHEDSIDDGQCGNWIVVKAQASVSHYWTFTIRSCTLTGAAARSEYIWITRKLVLSMKKCSKFRIVQHGLLIKLTPSTVDALHLNWKCHGLHWSFNTYTVLLQLHAALSKQNFIDALWLLIETSLNYVTWVHTPRQDWSTWRGFIFN